MIPPSVILDSPQLGENIGFTARAMLNCGLKDLRVITPRDGWPNPAALAAAAGASSVIECAKIFDCRYDAISDCHKIFAATARRREQIKRILTPRAAAAEVKAVRGNVQTGILFGPERSGLDNDAVALADAVIEVPINSEFNSLSLPQAVLLIAYEWQMTDEAAGSDIRPSGNLASKEKLLHFFTRLETALDDSGFFHINEKRQSMVRNIRNIFQRSSLTEQEVSTLQGIITSLTRRND